jgi:hypothetical protein
LRFRDVLSRKTEEDRVLGVLILWVVVVLLVMSIPSAKKTGISRPSYRLFR